MSADEALRELAARAALTVAARWPAVDEDGDPIRPLDPVRPEVMRDLAGATDAELRTERLRRAGFYNTYGGPMIACCCANPECARSGCMQLRDRLVPTRIEPLPRAPNLGWTCPECGRVNAPTVTSCDHGRVPFVTCAAGN